MTNQERYDSYIRIARNLKAQSEDDYREGARLRDQADQIDAEALEKFRSAERYEKAAEQYAPPKFTKGEVCCIDYTTRDRGKKRFYWNVKVVTIYSDGDIGIVWLDQERNECYRRLNIERAERVNY